MARKEVVDAAFARLGTIAGDGKRYWTDSDDVDVWVFDNNSQGEAPIDGTPFLVAQFPIANTERWPINQRTYRETGAIRLVIHTQTGSGTDLAHRWGDELADLFRDQNFSGVRCQVPTSPLTHDDNDAGNYHRTSVVVPYTFQFEDP